MDLTKRSKLREYSSLVNWSDIESKGFWPVVNTLQDIWCLCSIVDDPETGEEQILLFHDYEQYDNVKVWDAEDNKEYTITERCGSLLDGMKFWYLIGKNKGKLSVHNCMTYDKPILEKVMPKCVIPFDTWIDTFTNSKVQYFERTCPRGAKSGHSLLAYGIKHGIKKPPISDWTTMDAYKLHRVIEDVRIQKMAHKMLEREANALKKSFNIDFTEAIAIENEYAMGCQRQEVRGAPVDVEHIKKCIAWLDIETVGLSSKIEPMLPPTVKVSGARISRSEMGLLFGYKGIKDTYKQVKKDGETVTAVVKPYYKPTVNFYKAMNVNNYSGFHVSYGFSPSYVKKAELTGWIKVNHPDTKPKDWDIENVPIEGRVLNKNTCDYWGLKEEDLNYVVGAHTRVQFLSSKMSQHEVVKGKLISMGWKDAFEWNVKKDAFKQTVRADEDTWVFYPPRAAPENQMKVFIKKRQPILTSPKLTEKDHQFLPEGLGLDIAHYNTYSHRRRFLENPKDPEHKGLLSYVREDGRIPAGVNNFGTATSRSSHRVWVNAAGVGSVYGEEIRECIRAPEGRKLVGADMRSAQLSIAAFFAKNAEYYDAVASGQEEVDDPSYPSGKRYVGMSAHCHSARNFGIVSLEDFKRAVEFQEHDLLHEISLKRKNSKSSSFGVIFGCAGELLAKMLGIPAGEGNEKKDNFLRQMGLDGVAAWLETCQVKYKVGRGWYIPLSFGFWVHCKSPHKAINYLIQGTEAVCQKLAVNYFERKLPSLGIDAFKVLDYHDEYLCEASEEDAEACGELMCESYKWASDKVFEWYQSNDSLFPNEGKPLFAFNLDGGAKIGTTYLETH